MKEIILIGGGGHCAACLDVLGAAGQYRPAAIVDRPEALGRELCGHKITATDHDLPKLVARFAFALICLGQIKSAAPRRAIYQRLKELGAKLPVHISPLAYVSAHSYLNEGSIVMHQALVNARAQVGANAIINTRALLEHDVTVEPHCHISTGALLNGNCYIETGCFVGSGAVLREGIRIGAESVIGCGAVVVADVPPGSRVVGVWKGR